MVIQHKKDAKGAIIYTLPGNPTPLARPRFGRGRIFDKQKLLKINHGIILNHLHNNRPFYSGPLSLSAIFYLGFPSRMSRKRKKQLLGTPRPLRPDIDNYIKYILDVANKILFYDDALIAVVHAKKIYDPDPRTEFTITELTNERADQ